MENDGARVDDDRSIKEEKDDNVLMMIGDVKTGFLALVDR